MNALAKVHTSTHHMLEVALIGDAVADQERLHASGAEHADEGGSEPVAVARRALGLAELAMLEVESTCARVRCRPKSVRITWVLKSVFSARWDDGGPSRATPLAHTSGALGAVAECPGLVPAPGWRGVRVRHF